MGVRLSRWWSGANVYAFDTGINVNKGDFGGRAIATVACLCVLKSAAAQTTTPTSTVPMSRGLWRDISMASPNMQPSTEW